MSFEQICLYGGILLAGYLIGSIPCGYLIGRWYGCDIRKVGSGNIGATNVTRAVGATAGKICFGLDFLKGFLPLALLRCGTARGWFPAAAGGLGEAAMILGVVLGHMFTIFLRFKGGKGIATALGAVTAITPGAALAAFLIWLIVFRISGYVSLGSICGAVSLPFLAWFFSRLKFPPVSGAMLIFFAVLALAAVWKHRTNIRRLLDGTENRFQK